MANFLRINDLVTFSLLDENLMKVRDDFHQGLYQPKPEVQGQGGLLVRIAATHSGIITRNNGFYLPQMMREGAKSFTDNYQKPVLLHHEDHKDAIGRIVEAGYVDTSGSIQDQLRELNGLVVKDRFGKEKGTITEKSLKDFVDGRMPFGMQVEFVHTLLKDSLLEDKDYEGLGHIQIVARINDRQAIEKFLDGRYLTGSVGATTNRAVCSICKQDWTDSGQCEHKPGGMYEGSKCFIIAGKLMYDEYSVVNVPADRHSKVLELNYNGTSNVIDFANEYSGRTYETKLEFPQYDPTKEDGLMSKKKKDESAVQVQDSVETTPENTPETTPEVTPEAKVEDGHDEGTPPTADEGTPPEQIADGSTEVKPEETPADGETQVTDGATGEDSLDGLVDKLLDASKLEDEDVEKLYDALWAEIEAGFEDGEFTLEELGVEKLEDAKLSTEKRNKLAKSTFCGPGKSFPVPDCAHVTAARRLIGRYKGEGDKSKILACVSRKAKAMGCDSEKAKKKDAVEKNEDNMNAARIMHMVLATLEENQYSGESAPLADDEKNMLRGILKRLATMVGKDEFSEATREEMPELVESAEQALLDEVEKNETLVGDLREQLSALRKEYNDLYGDLETLQDSLSEAKKATREAKEAHATVLKALCDRKADEQAGWTEVSDSDLDSEVKRLTEEVDMKKITDKLGDGMSRTPEGDLDDPTGIQDGKTQKRTVTEAEMKKVEEHWHYLAFTKGQAVADAWFRTLNLEGSLFEDSLKPGQKD